MVIFNVFVDQLINSFTPSGFTLYYPFIYNNFTPSGFFFNPGGMK